MTKREDRPSDNRGILTLFDMDFSDGLCWAGNIYQKFDNVQLGDLFIQKPRGYVDALGEHVKDLLDDVAKDWLNRSGKCPKGPVSDLSLESDVIAEVCKKSRLVSLDHVHNQNGLPCVEAKPVASCVEESNNDASSDLPVQLIQREDLDAVSVEITSINSGREGNNTHKDAGDVDKLCAHSAESIVSPGDGIISEADFSSGISSLPENLDGFSLEQVSTSYDVVDLTTEVMEDFEDLKLEHVIDDSGKQELCLISDQSPKKVPYKKKLKQAFRSRVWSSKNDYEQMPNSHGCNNLGFQGSNLDPELKQGCLCENDWELV